jgi:hypothetical protein
LFNPERDIKRKLSYLAPLIVINIVIIFFIILTPPYIINEFSDTNGYLGLANNISFGRFFNTLPHNTYSLGVAFLYAPAFFLKNNTLRFISLYLIQLFFINLSIFTFTRAYKATKDKLPDKYLLAILLLSIGFLGQFFYIMSETIFTSFLIISLSLFVEFASSRKRNSSWYNFFLPIALGLTTQFLSSLRETGIVFTVFITIALIVTIISKRFPAKIILLYFLGITIGYLPELIQEFSIGKNPIYFSEPHSAQTVFSNYYSNLRLSLTNKERITQVFIPGITNQFLLYTLFTLGSTLVIYPEFFLIPFKKDSRSLDWALLIGYFVPVILHLGQSIFHLWGYFVSGVESTHMDRYLMPISTLTFALGIFSSRKKQKLKPLMTTLLYMLLTLSIAFPITFSVGPSISNRTFDFSIIEYMLPTTNAYVYTLILVGLSIISSIFYYKKEYKKLFYLVLVLFGFSYLINQSYFIEVSKTNNPRTQIVEKLAAEDNIKFVYLVYPSEVRVNGKIADYSYYFDYSRIFLTEDVKYIGLIEEDLDTKIKKDIPSLIVARRGRDLELPKDCTLKNQELIINSNSYSVFKCF